MEGSIERVRLNHAFFARSLHPSAKSQHIARLRPHYKVLHIDRSLHAARLVRPFEVPTESIHSKAAATRNGLSSSHPPCTWRQYQKITLANYAAANDIDVSFRYGALVIAS
jgi:hypothetical protein